MEKHKENFTQQDVELEQALVGNLIRNPFLIDKAQDHFDVTDLCDPLHRRIAESIFALHSSGTTVSPMTLQAAMRDDPGLKEVGHSYLTTLMLAAPHDATVISLAKAVKTIRRRRELGQLGQELTEFSCDTTYGPVEDEIERAEKVLYSLATRNTYGSRQSSFSEALSMAMKQAELAQENEGKIVGLETGFKDLDHMLGGLNKGNLIIIAGRPGMGKTALATNAAFYIASSGKPVLFFSLEMSTTELSQRILSEQSGVESWRIRNGQMRPPEWDDYVKKGVELREIPLFIDDTGGLSLPQVVARARKAKREHNICCIVVDYLQLMSGNRKDGNRVQEVTEITKGLKALAKELDVPVVALSQLSRGVDSRDDKRPVLSDLRESGSIEQDADVVAFVYRAAYYIKSREPDVSDPLYSKWMASMEKADGKADLIVEKNRHGATGPIHLAFDAKFTRFRDLEE